MIAPGYATASGILAEDAVVAGYLQARRDALCPVAYGREARWVAMWRTFLAMQGASLATATPEHADGFMAAVADRCHEERRRMPGRLRDLHAYLSEAGTGAANPFGPPSPQAHRGRAASQPKPRVRRNR